MENMDVVNVSFEFLEQVIEIMESPDLLGDDVNDAYEQACKYARVKPQKGLYTMASVKAGLDNASEEDLVIIHNYVADAQGRDGIKIYSTKLFNDIMGGLDAKSILKVIDRESFNVSDDYMEYNEFYDTWSSFNNIQHSIFFNKTFLLVGLTEDNFAIMKSMANYCNVNTKPFEV